MEEELKKLQEALEQKYQIEITFVNIDFKNKSIRIITEGIGDAINKTFNELS